MCNTNKLDPPECLLPSLQGSVGALTFSDLPGLTHLVTANVSTVYLKQRFHKALREPGIIILKCEELNLSTVVMSLMQPTYLGGHWINTK